MGARFRATVENTAVPGGPLALQIRPLNYTNVVESYNSTDPRTYGLPKIVDWHQTILGILEAEVAPTTDASPGFLSRPVLGRIAPPWPASRNASSIPTWLTNYRDGSTTRSGVTPGGTQISGPSFGSQISLPAFGGPSHRTFYARIVYPYDSPLLIYGCGTHNFETDGPIIPTVAGVLYCRSGQTGTLTTTNVADEPQTYSGTIVFEEL